MQDANKCQKHGEAYTVLCLSQDCHQQFLLCPSCKKGTSHKHSKTDLVAIKEIKTKLKASWQPKDSIVQPYFVKVREFYETLRKQISKLIDDDQKSVQNYLTKVKYYTLPVEVNSQVYLEFIKDEYERLDRHSIIKLVNDAQSSELNKNIEKQKQITKFLDSELKKLNDKVITIKYIMLSKKLQAELLIPHLPQQSKVCDKQQFVKIYSLFNSRKLLVRSIKLLYRASDNKFSSKDFYNRCNGSDNCLVIGRTKNKRLFGGYSPLSFVHHDLESLKQQKHYESDKSSRSFIFNLTNLKSYSIKDNEKALIYKKDAMGPSFGVDLVFDKMVTSSMGNSYQGPDGIAVDSIEAKVFLLETDKAELQEMQIWQMSF